MKSTSFISDELLSAYIDRKISEAELRRVEKALAEEPALQLQLAALQATVGLLQNAPAVVVPRALTLSESQVLAASGPTAWWRRWLPRLMPAATAVIAVLFLMSLLLPGLSEPAPAILTAPAEAIPVSRNVAPSEQASAPGVEMPIAVSQASESAAAPQPPVSAPEMASATDDVEEVNALAQEPPAPRAQSQSQTVAPGIAAAEAMTVSKAMPRAGLPATSERASAAAGAADAGAEAPPPQASSLPTQAPTPLTQPSPQMTPLTEAVPQPVMAVTRSVAMMQATTAPVAASVPTASSSPRVSLLSWLLGVLLILLLFATWRITIRPRRQG